MVDFTSIGMVLVSACGVGLAAGWFRLSTSENAIPLSRGPIET
jgi:hypothetical protein